MEGRLGAISFCINRFGRTSTSTLFAYLSKSQQPYGWHDESQGGGFDHLRCVTPADTGTAITHKGALPWRGAIRNSSSAVAMADCTSSKHARKVRRAITPKHE